MLCHVFHMPTQLKYVNFVLMEPTDKLLAKVALNELSRYLQARVDLQ